MGNMEYKSISSAPRMIIFDYGQTLANEKPFDGVAGGAALLKYATKNKYNYTAEQIQLVANELNRELGRFDPQRRIELTVEVPNRMFSAYLYRSLGIELSLSPPEIDRVFWDAASPAHPTEGIEDFLAYLWQKGIRTGVISNISYCGDALRERIESLLPDHKFEFIIASSEYMFRKPSPHIYKLALEMAELCAHEVWYIGDNFALDVEGANNAGMFAVHYIGALEARDLPDHVFSDLIYEASGGEHRFITVSSWDELAKIIDAI